jgi:hypothetical protein
MGEMPPLATDRYHPRRAWFHRQVQAGAVPLKLNAICAEGSTIVPDVFARATSRIEAAADVIAGTAHQGAGFAILHQGEEGCWLLLHWWLGGGILARKLWRADLAPDAPFEEADPLLLACVWELGIIEWERRAWIETVMAGEPVSRYMAREFSGEQI